MAAERQQKLKNISFKSPEDLHTAYRLICVANRKNMKSEFIKFMEREVAADRRKAAKKG